MGEKILGWFTILFCGLITLFFLASGNAPEFTLSIFNNFYTQACLNTPWYFVALGDACFAGVIALIWAGATDRIQLYLGHILFGMFVPYAIGALAFIGFQQY